MQALVGAVAQFISPKQTRRWVAQGGRADLERPVVAAPGHARHRQIPVGQVLMDFDVGPIEYSTAFDDEWFETRAAAVRFERSVLAEQSRVRSAVDANQRPEALL